ncbi:hypothetical protein [Gordonia jinghuaiqii]|uniref:Uncharacterized protein n=1 Tax=Gordonia jinghuaiqii TaxID=2758710 RepID=A0A7D7QU93_9ACTN|nr:hypothetical protein [Gordonia jinghuaiqii]QMS99648.1 hypothetical protein H1R19_03025 [Gordonia jinghuaiqii]
MDRWAGRQQRALAETSIRSVLSFQLFAGTTTIGALKLFADDPGVVFATHAAITWNTCAPTGTPHTGRATSA